MKRVLAILAILMTLVFILPVTNAESYTAIRDGISILSMPQRNRIKQEIGSMNKARFMVLIEKTAPELFTDDHVFSVAKQTYMEEFGNYSSGAVLAICANEEGFKLHVYYLDASLGIPEDIDEQLTAMYRTAKTDKDWIFDSVMTIIEYLKATEKFGSEEVIELPKEETWLDKVKTWLMERYEANKKGLACGICILAVFGLVCLLFGKRTVARDENKEEDYNE